jgi:tRNA (cytidine/uridine-2'-O-)-methyltransferase
MTLHVALIEPNLPTSAGKVAELCAGTDVPLHLIGPVGFALDDEALQHEGGDLWPHPDWFAFRDAISRDRCLYFTSDAKVDFTRAPFQKNSVLVFANEKDGMPARILEKHRQRCYRLPKGTTALPDAVRTVLAEGLQKLGLGRVPAPAPAAPAAPAAPLAVDEHDEPNFNIAPRLPAVPDDVEEEDEINYNVEQAPRSLGNGTPARAPRGGGRPPVGPPGPGGRPRRGRGGRGRPKPKR